MCFQSLGKYDMPEEYVKQALLLRRDIGNNLNEFHCLCDLSVLKVSSGHFEEVLLSFLRYREVRHFERFSERKRSVSNISSRRARHLSLQVVQ